MAKCLTPGCIYHSHTTSRALAVSVSLPSAGGFQLDGLLGHMTVPERGTPTQRGQLGALYEQALHDAIEPAVAAILRADAAYKAVVGNIGNPDGPMRDRAYDAARAALSSAEGREP